MICPCKFTRPVLYMALLWFGVAHPQTPDVLWERTFGGGLTDYGRSVVEAYAGGYIVCGKSNSFGQDYYDLTITGISVTGESLWSRRYGGESHDEAYKVACTPDGGYITCGQTMSYGAGGCDVYIVRTDSTGDSLWTRVYGGGQDDEGRDIQPAPDGGFIVVGYTRSFGTGEENGYTIRIDSLGESLWTRTWAGPGMQQQFLSVVPTPDRCWLMAGYTRPGLTHVALLKMDDAGETLWTRIYTPPTNSVASDVTPTRDSGFFVTGYIGEQPGWDLYMMRLNADGDTLWTKTLSTPAYDECGYSCVQTTDGGFLVSGRTYASGESDPLVIKTDADGSVLWSQTYMSGPGIYASDLTLTSDGGFIATGLGSGPGIDQYVLKSVPTGNLVRNGDFSYWADSAHAFGWTVSDTGRVAVARCANPCRSAPAAAALTRLLPGGGDDAALTRLVPVTGGQAYEVTGWFLDNDSCADGGLVINWLDADTTYIRSSTMVHTELARPEWQQLTVVDVAPSTAAFARIVVQSSGLAGRPADGRVAVDDIALITTQVGVGEVLSQPRVPAGMRFSPNPARGFTVMSCPAGIGSVSRFRLCDISGRPVRTYSLPNGTGESRWRLDIRGLAGGVYTLRAESLRSPIGAKLVIAP